MVSRRLKLLVDETKIIGEGNLDHPVIIGTSQDELGELALAFESMRVKLKIAQDRIIHSERLSTIGQMASSIVHDFRSPMATINLIIESLQQGKQTDPSRIQEWYRLIRESVQRMVSMAQELMDFSRGDTRLEKSEFAIDDFLALVEKSVKINLERANITFEIDNQCSGTAVFDPDRLHRAIVNIINNAQDATPAGGSVKVAAWMENGEVAFRISDTGKGIPGEIREKIFDAFVTMGKKKGTGLGLAITKRIIDQHEGTIEVKSAPGMGTTFVIRLPHVFGDVLMPN
jgi:signal transduction histidine kinase